MYSASSYDNVRCITSCTQVRRQQRLAPAHASSPPACTCSRNYPFHQATSWGGLVSALFTPHLPPVSSPCAGLIPRPVLGLVLGVGHCRVVLSMPLCAEQLVAGTGLFMCWCGLHHSCPSSRVLRPSRCVLGHLACGQLVDMIFASLSKMHVPLPMHPVLLCLVCAVHRSPVLLCMPAG